MKKKTKQSLMIIFHFEIPAEPDEEWKNWNKVLYLIISSSASTKHFIQFDCKFLSSGFYKPKTKIGLKREILFVRMTVSNDKKMTGIARKK
jgi:hypothetical protein